MMTVELQLATIVIAALAGVISKICYDWLSNKRPQYIPSSNKSKLDSRNETRLIKIGDEVEWLKEVHSKTDLDGLPLWYVPRDLQKISKETSDRLMETNLILRDIRDSLKDNSELMHDILKDVQSLKK